jgi:hypothetical protein
MGRDLLKLSKPFAPAKVLEESIAQQLMTALSLSKERGWTIGPMAKS